MRTIYNFVLLGLCAVLIACSPAQSNDTVALDVYKSPTCGCCALWVDHAEDRDFSFRVHHLNNEELTLEKLRRGIGLRYHSCHTAVAENGAVFEGHIPAHLIRSYLDDTPADSLGLAVPGMPIGSPGMEVGERLDPYQVLLLKKDGTVELYAQVTDLQSQYQ